MSPASTNQRAPAGSIIRLGGIVHTAGQCCQSWKCEWCSNPIHQQAREAEGVVFGIAESCESCDYDNWIKVTDDLAIS